MHQQKRSRSDPGSVFRRGFLCVLSAGAVLSAIGAGRAAGQQEGGGPNGGGGGPGGDGAGGRGNVAGEALVATLSGDQEVPPVETETSGSARFTPTDDGGIDYRLGIRTLACVTQAHVHEGFAGSNGSIVADLLTATESVDGSGGGEPLDATAGEPIVEEGTITDTDLAERILDRPGRFYVNVHTVEHPPGEIRGQIRHEGATEFAVRIENVSTPDTLTPSTGGSQPVPLSPGVYAVHSNIGPLITPGIPDRGDGLEAVAEDGDPSDLGDALGAQAGIVDSGTFTTPVDADEPAPIGPGGAYEFGVVARPGQHLSLATMFVPSNDLFYAPDECGIALYDDTGDPVEGDVTEHLALWDVGTEENEEPGVGENQVQRQSGPDTGPDEGGTARPIETVDDGYTYPDVAEVVRVTVSPSSLDRSPLRSGRFGIVVPRERDLASNAAHPTAACASSSVKFPS